jgi:HEAT repeat protein
MPKILSSNFFGMRRWMLFLCFALLTSPNFLFSNESSFVKKIELYLAIRDFRSAAKEAREAISKHPASFPLHVLLLNALSNLGEEREALSVWKTFHQRKEDKKDFFYREEDRRLLETLAWGILKSGTYSSQKNIAASALIGMGLTRDSRALPCFLQCFRSSSPLLRTVAAHLSPHLGDFCLQRELGRLLKEESVWYVRLEVIRAIGQLRIKDLKTPLEVLIADSQTLPEEKAAALIALSSIYDRISLKQLRQLLNSNRAGLRELACEIVKRLHLKEYSSELFPLLNDSCPDVRVFALSTLGLLSTEIPFSRIEPLLRDMTPEVAITASWFAALSQKEEGWNILMGFCSDPHPKRRRLAAAALASTGFLGKKWMAEEMVRQKDPYVKTSLALGLIGQRHEIKKASSFLYQFLQEEKEGLWMMDTSHPLFHFLAPSSLRHRDEIPHFPVVMDQLVTLDILSALALAQHPQALEAAKKFLKSHRWGISATAASLFIEEGDEETANLVRELLEDPDENIRIQAALVLSAIGPDSTILSTLEKSYQTADREVKMTILESIGRIGDPTSIPFLIQVMEEPAQILRIIAASSLIQCLYH